MLGDTPARPLRKKNYYKVIEKNEKSSIDGRVFKMVRCEVMLLAGKRCNRELPLTGIKAHIYHKHGIDLRQNKSKKWKRPSTNKTSKESRK